MLITIISLIVFVGSLVGYLVYLKVEGNWYSVPNGVVVTFLFSTVFISVVALILGVRLATEPIEYEKMQMQQGILMYRIEELEENEDGSYAEVQLYYDVVDFNRQIMNSCYWANNLWTSWFSYNSIGDMETIKFEGGGNT